MTSSEPWKPYEVHLGKVKTDKKDDRYSTLFQRVNEVWSHNNEIKYVYHDNKSDETILHSIEPSLIILGELTREKYDSDTLDIPLRRTFVSGDRHNRLNAGKIAEMWCIGPNRAQATMMATTQRGVRSVLLPISRRYRSDRMYNIK